MNYEGRLYGKMGGKYVLLVETSKSINKLETMCAMQNDIIKGWEQTMMTAIGAEGIRSVAEAIDKLKEEKAMLLNALEWLVGANGWTFDCVCEAVDEEQLKSLTDTTDKLWQNAIDAIAACSIDP